MKRFSFSLLILLPQFVAAQKDSINYFLTLLKNISLIDSVRGHVSIQISDYYIKKNPSKSFYYSKAAYGLAKKTNSDDLLYRSCNNLAESFRNIGAYDSSLYYAKICNEASLRLNIPSVLFNSFNLTGSIYLEKLDLPNAKKQYDEALKLMEANPEISNKSRFYQNLGNYYFKLLNFKKSIEILRLGESEAKKEEREEELMRIYSAIGQQYSYIGNPDSAQYYLFTALNYFHSKGLTSDEALVNQKLGSAFGLFNNTAKMEQYLDIAYKQFKSTGDDITAVNTLMLKINSYFRSYQFNKCLMALSSAEPEALKNNQKPALAMAALYKTGIFSLTGDTTNARKYQQIAEDISKQFNIPAFDNMNQSIKRFVILSHIKIKQGDSTIQKSLIEVKKLIPASLMQISLETVALNKDLVAGNKKDVLNAFETMLGSDTSKTTPNYDSLISRPIDSTLSALSNRQLLQMETFYRTKQKDDSIHTQVQLLGLKNQSIKNRNYFVFALGTLALFITFLLIRSVVQSGKINRQYKEIHQLQSELTHRTGNFFNSIKGMLATAAITTSDKETIVSLDKRVGTINRLFNTLYSSPETTSATFSQLLSSICNDFEFSFGAARNIKVYSSCNAIVSREEAVPLAFIITEILTNAEKYAFTEKDTGEIQVQILEKGDNRILHIWDNGHGRDESIPARSGSQGMGIIKSYSKNLNGTISTWNDNGFHFKMNF